MTGVSESSNLKDEGYIAFHHKAHIINSIHYNINWTIKWLVHL
ncbi:MULTISPECIES: hypothetical protein [Photorhabdus]|nr:hypothetical protein [Photorhabdus asymbiotica]